MKKPVRVLLYLLAILIVVMIGSAGYLWTAYPDVGPPPDIEVERNMERIERGEYLVEHVAVCVDCHSKRDWSKFAGPIVPGTKGQGGRVFDEKYGLPGSFTAKNITPYNLEDWSDGELYRLITTGVTKEGEPLHPIMPYLKYRKMAEEDVKAIIAYLRTLEPIENEVPPSDPDFPMNFIERTIPKPADPMERPKPSNEVKRGEYLVKMAGCSGCHTPKKKNGQPDMERYMAGGYESPLPTGGVVRSANITPHKETGLGSWSKKAFIERFTAYRKEEHAKVDSGAFQTFMPWTMFAEMKKEDLGAIYEYLQTIEPVENEVERFSEQ